MIKQDISENLAKISYLAIGSNLGNKLENIEKAKFELQKNKVKIIKTSSNYVTESWPNSSNPMYVNIVIKVKTILSALDLLKVCNLIEKKLGRVRSVKNAPRLCDIDIIDYNQKILNLENNNLIIPHQSMRKRNFVLLPLFEIDKTWKHPKYGTNIVELINSLPVKDLRSIKQI